MLERVGVIFVGGCAGGLTRYAVTKAWPSPTYGFPWSTFTVNVAGAFVLGLVVILAADRHDSRRARLLLGTGFCGALTTFGSVVVAVDELLAHHHIGVAITYVATTTAAALIVVAAAVTIARALATRW